MQVSGCRCLNNGQHYLGIDKDLLKTYNLKYSVSEYHGDQIFKATCIFKRHKNQKNQTSKR